MPSGDDDRDGAVPLTTRGIRRRTELLSVTRKVVGDGGFRELQMTTVASAADVAVGTFYRYFPSKAALCAALVAHVSDRELSVIKEVVAAEGSAAERLRDVVRSFVRRALIARRLAYAMIAEPVDPEVEDVRLLYRARISEQFRTLVAEGVAAGEFGSEDPDTAAACIVGAFMEAVIGPGRPGSRPAELGADRASHPTRVANEAARFCLSALRTSEVAALPERSSRQR